MVTFFRRRFLIRRHRRRNRRSFWTNRRCMNRQSSYGLNCRKNMNLRNFCLSSNRWSSLMKYRMSSRRLKMTYTILTICSCRTSFCYCFRRNSFLMTTRLNFCYRQRALSTLSTMTMTGRRHRTILLRRTRLRSRTKKSRWTVQYSLQMTLLTRICRNKILQTMMPVC